MICCFGCCAQGQMSHWGLWMAVEIPVSRGAEQVPIAEDLLRTFLSPPSGLPHLPANTQGLRPGLYSFAASRLWEWSQFHYELQKLALIRLKSCAIHFFGQEAKISGLQAQTRLRSGMAGIQFRRIFPSFARRSSQRRAVGASGRSP